MKFRLIPPGRFQMGGTPDEINAAVASLDPNDPNFNHMLMSTRSESPQHEVVLTSPFFMSVHEVTQQQYAAVVGQNPAFHSKTGMDRVRADLVANRDTSNYPVENVSWTDAVEFSRRLSQMEGLQPYPAFGQHGGSGYRLPTEAEWEFACRAGTTTSFWFGSSVANAPKFGWDVTNSLNQTHEVGQFPANPFGLCDTCGNVWEWCQDYWDSASYQQSQSVTTNPLTRSTGDAQHMLRGGSFYYSLQRCRSSHRTMTFESTKDWNIGFRVVLAIEGVRAAKGNAIDPSNVSPPGLLRDYSSRSVRVQTVKPMGDPVDILAQIDLSRDVHAGKWEWIGSSLMGNVLARLYLPVKPPEDYQLKFNLKRVENADTLIVGFIMAGRVGMIGIDVNNSELTSLYVDSLQPHLNSTRIDGQVFQNGMNAELVLTVHPSHLHVAVNGKPLLDWHGAPERLYFFPEHAMPNRETPFLTVANAKYQFDAISIVPIEPENVPPRIATLDSQIDVMPLFDLNRDAYRGGWQQLANGLESHVSNTCRLSIPVDVPEEYTLSATVERPLDAGGDQSLTFGILAGESLCQIFTSNVDGPGLDKIDGRRWNNNETSLRGMCLTPGVPTNISATVRKNQIRLEIGGRTMIDWHGDFASLSISGEWPPPDGRKLFFCTTGQFRIRDVRLGPPVDSPTLPEHAPFAVGRALNLLPLIDPVRDAFAGTWSKDVKSLRMLGDVGSSKLIIPCNVPDEYQLTLVLGREPGGRLENDCLTLQLPIGPVMADLMVDAHASTVTGIHLDGRDLLPATFATKVTAIPPGMRQAIICSVRRTGLKVATADQTIFEWTGNPERYTTSYLRATPSSKIAIGSWNSRFRIDRLELEPLSPSAFAPVGNPNSVGKLLPTIQVQRDARIGEWKRESEGIVSPKVPAARLRIPVVPPENYVLSANLERRSGIHQLTLGFVVGGHPCSVEIDGIGAGGGGGYQSGLECVDGRLFFDDANLTRQLYPWPLAPKGKSIFVRCIVLPDTVVVTCDDREVVRWHGDPRRFSQESSFLPPNCTAADRSQLWIGAWDSEILVRDLELQPIGEDIAERISAEFSGPYPTRLASRIPLADAKLSSQNLGLKATEELAVLSAKYGVADKSVDLTERLNELAKTGSLRLAVDDSLAGDSGTGLFDSERKPRSLRLRYRLNGAIFQRSFGANEAVELDARPLPEKASADKFELIEARRGSGIYHESTWADVTQAVRPFVQHGSLQLADEQLLSVLSSKPTANDATTSTAIYVRYRDRGVERSTVIPRGSRALLGDVPHAPGLLMVAYAGANFDDERLVRIDPNIDVDFGLGSPGPGLPSDNFSVRWQGTLSVPAAGNYTFSCHHDDGVTLWLDDQLRYVVWGRASDDRFDLLLEKKDYQITVQYYDQQVVGAIRLEWKSNSIPQQTIPASAFSHDPRLLQQHRSFLAMP